MILSVGCGPSGYLSAEGVVTLDGQPLSDATVMFVSPDKALASARTNSEGEFRMETGSIEGIKPGEYAVTVTAFQKSEKTGKPIPKLATPEKYSTPELSELKVVINGEGNDNLVLALRSF